MEFRNLIASLPGKKSAIYTFERGKAVQHPHSALHGDVVRARDALRGWGVRAGTRVGIYAPNSYKWLVYDLALIELGAISVPFTDDFAGKIDQQLLDRYNIALLLLSKKDAQLFPQRPAHVAFLDADNQPVTPDGGHLRDIVRLVSADPPFETMDVLCDVTNPLFGPSGAAWIYGRQKGGSDAVLAELDEGLKHIAQVVKAQTGRDVAQMPGAGAAGGLGYGAVAFLGAKLRRGIEVVLDMTGFEAAAAKADLIITGEGHLDGQSAQGKLIQGLCGRSRGKPVIALCGKLSASPQQVKAIGLKAAYSINKEERPLAEMLANTAVNLEKTAAELSL